MSPAPAGWPLGLLSDALEKRVPPSRIQKRPLFPCLFFFLTSNKARQLLGEGLAGLGATKEPAVRSSCPPPPPRD